MHFAASDLIVLVLSLLINSWHKILQSSNSAGTKSVNRKNEQLQTIGELADRITMAYLTRLEEVVLRVKTPGSVASLPLVVYLE